MNSNATDDLLRQAADPECKHCDGHGIFYGNVAICGCVNRHHYKRALDASVDHAEGYRRLFFSFRDENDQLRDELAANRRIREHQRAIIAELEQRLGVDQEL